MWHYSSGCPRGGKCTHMVRIGPNFKDDILTAQATSRTKPGITVNCSIRTASGQPLPWLPGGVILLSICLVNSSLHVCM